MNSQPLWEKCCILIEGNIAAGKSTFIQRLQARLEHKAVIINEPLDKWTNLKGDNLLNLMYENPSKNSFQLQTYIQLTMAMNQHKLVHTPFKILERSLQSERYVFIEALKILNNITPIEYNILDAWFQWLDLKSPAVGEIIYLRTLPEVALQRLQQRKRSEETVVTLPYLELIHDLHEKWIGDLQQSGKPHVRIIDQNQTLEDTLSAADQVAEDILTNLKRYNKVYRRSYFYNPKFNFD